MADKFATLVLLAFPFILPVLFCTQPVFDIKTPGEWYPSHAFGTTDLIRDASQEIELLYTNGPFLRQKLSVNKAILLEATQLVDLTDFGIRTTNLRRTNDLAKLHGVRFRHQDFLGLDQKFALRKGLTHKQCLTFCQFNKADMFTDLNSVAELHNIFPTVQSLWIKARQNSTMTSVTSATYQLKVGRNLSRE